MLKLLEQSFGAQYAGRQVLISEVGSTSPTRLYTQDGRRITSTGIVLADAQGKVSAWVQTGRDYDAVVLGHGSNPPEVVDVKIGTLSSAQTVAFSEGRIQSSDGSLFALSEVAVPVILSASGSARSTACEYRGVKIRAVSGSVSLLTYDALSAVGTPLDTFSNVSITGGPFGNGFYPYANGLLGRANTTGLYVDKVGAGTVEFEALVN